MTDPAPGQVLFDFVRHWSRRTASGESDPADRGRVVLVVEATRSLTGRGVAATVNAIAHEIGIDQSGASRLVRNATDAGYLTTQVSGSDGRRRESSLTTTGEVLLEQAHRWQDEVFSQLSAGWSERRRRDFSRAMIDLMRRSHDLGF